MNRRDTPVAVELVEHRGKTYSVAIYINDTPLAGRALYEIARRAIRAAGRTATAAGGLFTVTAEEIKPS